MNESQVLDFKPRARGMLIGGVAEIIPSLVLGQTDAAAAAKKNPPYLARIADKARAKMAGRIGDYIYPCPADQRFLQEMQMSAEEFTRLVASCASDDELVEKIKAHLAAKTE